MKLTCIWFVMKVHYMNCFTCSIHSYIWLKLLRLIFLLAEFYITYKLFSFNKNPQLVLNVYSSFLLVLCGSTPTCHVLGKEKAIYLTRTTTDVNMPLNPDHGLERPGDSCESRWKRIWPSSTKWCETLTNVEVACILKWLKCHGCGRKEEKNFVKILLFIVLLCIFVFRIIIDNHLL